MVQNLDIPLYNRGLNQVQFTFSSCKSVSLNPFPLSEVQSWRRRSDDDNVEMSREELAPRQITINLDSLT
ncbi:hypothetical protein CEXT_173001 [Caerostris extrusa]|uniref:Uncharacterized protein n=1 Tax=Caerostris extrusa TaxID=172846 RepID=A0AAV4P999_CAEEX|nr:hypothetical protein CEXT_173001 [Caerostris extrusa]